MAKKLLIIVASLLVVLVVLCGCESFKAKKITGGQSDALVESNGGLAVKQGDYMYYINGVGAEFTEAEQNYFGKVIKGAIVRSKINADGTFGAAEMIVPKTIASISTTDGFSIFGQWIYYVSKTTLTNNKGVLNANEFMFYRTKIDSSKTELIKTIVGESIKYRFHQNGLFYLNGTDLYSINYTDKKIKKADEVLVSANVSNAIFPKQESYSVADATAKVADNIFYTKTIKDTTDAELAYNEVYVANHAGVNKLLIGQKTFSENPTYENTFKIEIKAHLVEGANVALYYGKTITRGGTAVVKGLYKTLITNELTFEKASEVLVQEMKALPTNIFPISYDAGIIVYDDANLKLIKNASTSFIITNFGTIVPKFMKAEQTNAGTQGQYLYYEKNNLLCKSLIIDENNNFVDNENERIIVAKTVGNTFVLSDVVGKHLFYISTTDANYTHAFDLTRYTAVDDENQTVDVLVGIKTEKEANETEEDSQ